MAEGAALSHRPASKTARGRWKRARRTKDGALDDDAKGIEMQEFFSAVVHLDNSAGCTFNLDSVEERKELALMCWGVRGSMRELPKLTADN
eukprot:3680874-Pleurochrysis_carterae.AAC.1